MVTGPGWVQAPERKPHPKSTLVVVMPRVAMVWTPCHGTRQLYPQHQAVAGAWLPAVCEDCDDHLTVEFQSDPTAESGLRARWPDADQEQARDWRRLTPNPSRVAVSHGTPLRHPPCFADTTGAVITLLIILGLLRRWIVCSTCGQVKLARAFFPRGKPRLVQRVQLYRACCRNVPVEATIPLVARALQICEKAELELPAMLLTDVLDVLTDPDVPD